MHNDNKMNQEFAIQKKVAETQELGAKIIEQETIVLNGLVQSTLRSYADKPKELSDREWLVNEFNKELPEATDEECKKYADEIVSSIGGFGNSLKSINEYCDNGGKKEKWVADSLINGCSTLSAIKAGEYLSAIDNVLSENNRLLAETIVTNAGTVSQNKNLHGFIAEQLHANSFNRNAAVQGSSLRASVLTPDGHGYGRNSVDIVIKDDIKIVERYQAKFCKDIKATTKAVLDGNYNNQRILVPKGQQQGVAGNLPTKSVSDKIGGNVKTTGITSEALSKKQTLKIQEHAQSRGIIKKDSWNSFSNKQLTMNIGKQVAVTSVMSASLAVGVDVAAKALRGEKIDSDEVAEVAIMVGTDSAAKTTMAFALKIGTEKGLLTMLPKGISGYSVAAIACVAVENVKVAYKVAKGEMTVMQGVDAMGRATCAGIGAFIGGNDGFFIGGILGYACLMSNPIGLAIGAITGTVIGAAAGAKIASVVYTGAKAVVKGVAKVVGGVAKAVCTGVKGVVSSVCSSAKSAWNALTSW